MNKKLADIVYALVVLIYGDPNSSQCSIAYHFIWTYHHTSRWSCSSVLHLLSSFKLRLGRRQITFPLNTAFIYIMIIKPKCFLECSTTHTRASWSSSNLHYFSSIRSPSSTKNNYRYCIFSFCILHSSLHHYYNLSNRFRDAHLLKKYTYLCNT